MSTGKGIFQLLQIISQTPFLCFTRNSLRKNLVLPSLLTKYGLRVVDNIAHYSLPTSRCFSDYSYPYWHPCIKETHFTSNYAATQQAVQYCASVLRVSRVLQPSSNPHKSNFAQCFVFKRFTHNCCSDVPSPDECETLGAAPNL